MGGGLDLCRSTNTVTQTWEIAGKLRWLNSDKAYGILQMAGKPFLEKRKQILIIATLNRSWTAVIMWAVTSAVATVDQLPLPSRFGGNRCVVKMIKIDISQLVSKNHDAYNDGAIISYQPANGLRRGAKAKQ